MRETQCPFNYVFHQHNEYTLLIAPLTSLKKQRSDIFFFLHVILRSNITPPVPSLSFCLSVHLLKGASGKNLSAMLPRATRISLQPFSIFVHTLLCAVSSLCNLSRPKFTWRLHRRRFVRMTCHKKYVIFLLLCCQIRNAL